MSTDPTRPNRPPSSRPPDPAAPTEVTPSFRPAQSPARREPSFRPAQASPASPEPAPGQAGWPGQPPRYSPPAGGYQQDSRQPGVPPSGHRAGAAPGYGARPPRRRRRGRGLTMTALGVIVLLILAFVADRVAKGVAENDIADQVKTQANLTGKPSVSIPGFPFLTQVLAKDIHEIDITANNIPAGPVDITSVHAVASGVHINSTWNGGLVDTINGTAFISFGSVASAVAGQAGSIANITLTQAGPNQIKATASAGPLSITEIAKVTQDGNKVTVTWEPNNSNSSAGGIIGSLADGSLPDLSFTIPKLPAGLQVASISVTSQGIVATVSGHDTQLSE